MSNLESENSSLIVTTTWRPLKDDSVPTLQLPSGQNNPAARIATKGNTKMELGKRHAKIAQLARARVPKAPRPVSIALQVRKLASRVGCIALDALPASTRVRRRQQVRSSLSHCSYWTISVASQLLDFERLYGGFYFPKSDFLD